jgi:hypothetical protein
MGGGKSKRKILTRSKGVMIIVMIIVPGGSDEG